MDDLWIGFIVIDEEFVVEIFAEGPLEKLQEFVLFCLEGFLEVFSPDVFDLVVEVLGIVFADIEADLVGEAVVVSGDEVFEEVSEFLGLREGEVALGELHVVTGFLVFLLEVLDDDLDKFSFELVVEDELVGNLIEVVDEVAGGRVVGVEDLADDIDSLSLNGDSERLSEFSSLDGLLEHFFDDGFVELFDGATFLIFGVLTGFDIFVDGFRNEAFNVV